MTNGELSRERGISVYLGLGSNIGDREVNLRDARELIVKTGIDIVRQSSIYETEPVGFTDQPWFLNQVVEARLSVQPSAAEAASFLYKLLDIERKMGRERATADRPRLIDIDLLLFDDLVVHNLNDTASCNSAEIVLPHPRMHERRFVLEPLCEIAPDLTHPILHKTCHEILASLADESIVMLFKKQ